MVELADTRDLKSLGSNIVPVQVRSAAPKSKSESFDLLLFFCVRSIQHRFAVKRKRHLTDRSTLFDVMANVVNDVASPQIIKPMLRVDLFSLLWYNMQIDNVIHVEG